MRWSYDVMCCVMYVMCHVICHGMCHVVGHVLHHVMYNVLSCVLCAFIGKLDQITNLGVRQTANKLREAQGAYSRQLAHYHAGLCLCSKPLCSPITVGCSKSRYESRCDQIVARCFSLHVLFTCVLAFAGLLARLIGIEKPKDIASVSSVSAAE